MSVFERMPWWCEPVHDMSAVGIIWTLPVPKSDYDRGREAGLERAADICEEYAKVTVNPERARGAEILAKDIKREIERSA